MEPLTWLKGSWQGNGQGDFPTIDPFIFEDQMHFRIIEDAFESEPLIHFEEIAWVIKGKEKNFMHWETGFFKPTPQGLVQFYMSHNTGRIEATYGKFQSIDRDAKSFKIIFESDFIRNDEGIKTLVSSKRVLDFKKDHLTYSLAMTTDVVDKSTNHLITELIRSE